MIDMTTDAPFRRLGVRRKLAQLPHSEALKGLLEEFALWTAVWTGFPLSHELPRATAAPDSCADRTGHRRPLAVDRQPNSGAAESVGKETK